jgi:AcrR family transcriptional regulator
MCSQAYDLTFAYRWYTNTHGMRMTRAESKQQTRAAILAAAREVFARDGFHGARLERVAERAGFTKGAVYSAFDSKADLFMAVYEARVAERAARSRAQAPRSLAEALGAGAAEWRAVMRSERAWSAALTEFWVHASRDPALRKRFGAAHRAWRATVAESIEAAAAIEGRALPVPGKRIATAVMALGNGLALEGLLGEDDSDLLELVIGGLIG